MAAGIGARGRGKRKKPAKKPVLVPAPPIDHVLTIRVTTLEKYVQGLSRTMDDVSKCCGDALIALRELQDKAKRFDGFVSDAKTFADNVRHDGGLLACEISAVEKRIWECETKIDPPKDEHENRLREFKNGRA